jgi:NDP-sugar pyrophosphorylase family protein
MKALILAAGQGTRLGTLTAKRPKPMLPVQGKPLLEHTLAWLRRYGIVDIAINVHHHPEVIAGHFGDGDRFGVRLTYSREEKLLGTAGAAKRLAAYLNEPFVVVYGDVFTNLDLTRLIALHQQGDSRRPAAALMTLALYRVPNPTQCGLVETAPDGRIVRFVEKPDAAQVFTDLAFSGVMVCQPAILDQIPPDVSYDYGHDLLPRLLAAGAPLYAQAIAPSEYVIDIGTLQGYLAALDKTAQPGKPARMPALVPTTGGANPAVIVS